MRLLPLVLLTALVVGCVSPSATTPSPGAAAAQTMGGWTLDCAPSAAEQARNPSWPQACEARASHTAGAKQEIWTAINPKNPDNVVIAAKDDDPESSASCVWNGVFVTLDGGKTWKDVVIGGKYADRDPTSPYYGYACNTDPDFRFTSDGLLHYGVEMYNLAAQSAWGPGPDNPVYHMLPGGEGIPMDGYKILLATSADGGLTWPTVITFQPDEFVTTDFSRMTVNPVDDAILEAIGSDGGQGCHVLRSLDDGKSAQPPVEVVTPLGLPCNSGAQTAIAASPKGTIVLMGGSVTDPTSSSANDTPIVVRSTDDGATWMDYNAGFGFAQIPQFKESQARDESLVEIAYDLSNGTRRGTLYAVYAAQDGKDESDILLRASPDDGKTWTPAVRVNQDGTEAHHWMPNLAVAGDGSVHVFFLDKTYDPARKLIDVTHAVSLDGGKTWQTQRVSSVPFDGDLGVHQNGFPFVGDYLGVACGATDCWAGFPDASNGQVTVVAAAHVTKTG
ncbi:MAG: hypothetical protein QOE90_3228 [Thermoplasmata archaeon]|jgi:hypothetical protein|nr:hypothetical protein [Thermoplasmata archaeon]